MKTQPLIFLLNCFLIIVSCHDKSHDIPASYKVLVVEQGSGQVKVLNERGIVLDSVKVGYNPHEIEYDDESDRTFVTNFGVEDYDYTIGIPGTSLSVIKVESMTLLEDWPSYRTGTEIRDTTKGPHGIKKRPSSANELFVNVEYGDSMYAYNMLDGQIINSFAVPSGTHNFVFSKNGNIIWLFAGEKGLFKFDAASGIELDHFEVSTPIRGITLTGDEEKIILSCQNEIYILNTSDLSISQHFTDLGVKQILYSCLSPDEEIIFAPCPYDNIVLVINRNDGNILRRIECGKAPIYVKVDPNKTHAYVANALDDHMSVIDLEDYSVKKFGHINRPNGFLFIVEE